MTFQVQRESEVAGRYGHQNTESYLNDQPSSAHRRIQISKDQQFQAFSIVLP